MDVQFELEPASSTIENYQTVIKEFLKDQEILKGIIETVTTTDWKGEAAESFLARYRIWDAEMTEFISTLECTKEALEVLNSDADTLKTESEKLIQTVN